MLQWLEVPLEKSVCLNGPKCRPRSPSVVSAALFRLEYVSNVFGLLSLSYRQAASDNEHMVLV